MPSLTPDFSRVPQSSLLFTRRYADILVPAALGLAYSPVAGLITTGLALIVKEGRLRHASPQNTLSRLSIEEFDKQIDIIGRGWNCVASLSVGLVCFAVTGYGMAVRPVYKELLNESLQSSTKIHKMATYSDFTAGWGDSPYRKSTPSVELVAKVTERSNDNLNAHLAVAVQGEEKLRYYTCTRPSQQEEWAENTHCKKLEPR